jgi:VanZ family protein
MSMSSLDETSFRPRWLVRGSVTLLIAYWLVMITATHIPKVPEPLGFRPSDKLLHFTAYAVLGGLVGLVCTQFQPLRFRVAVVLFVGIAVHGILDEVTQPMVGRHADVADWFADIAGAAAGLGLFMIATTLMRRWRNTPAAEAAR